jgi:hypothetical protein
MGIATAETISNDTIPRGPVPHPAERHPASRDCYRARGRFRTAVLGAILSTFYRTNVVDADCLHRRMLSSATAGKASVAPSHCHETLATAGALPLIDLGAAAFTTIMASAQTIRHRHWPLLLRGGGGRITDQVGPGRLS